MIYRVVHALVILGLAAVPALSADFDPRAAGVAWAITQTHISNFSNGQPVAIFTIKVKNLQGSGPTSGTVTLTNISPVGAVLAGANWNCSGSVCTRSDSLAVGDQYPPVTAVVDLSIYAASTVTNQVTVSGGGLAQASSTDSATFVPAFTDVLASDSFLPAIDLLREAGVTTGCSPTTYCGNDEITQAQMAVFVVRSVTGGDNFTYTQTPFFGDVPAANPYFKWVQKMQDLGIALSCGQNLFCPDAAVTRGQMAVLIIRGRYNSAAPPNSPATPAFDDVPTSGPQFTWIQKMKQVGITTGCSPTSYCPNTPVTRGQMAVFIMRGLFNLLLPAATPELSLSHAVLQQDASVSLTIQGLNTHFVNGTTQVSAGAGISVRNVNVVNATTLVVEFQAASIASPGLRSVVVTTGAEEATAVNGFLVEAKF